MMIETLAASMAPFAAPEFLSGGGAAGARLRDYDWSRSLLGPARDWPEAMRTTLRIVLAAELPMALVWGPERMLFQNDACAALAGEADAGDDAPRGWPLLWP